MSMDESELTTNQSGLRSGRKAKAEKTVTAKLFERDKQGESVGNKTSLKESGCCGSRVRGDALPGFVIFQVEPDQRWWKHPAFKPPDTTWKHPVSGKPFTWKTNYNESGCMTSS